MRECYRCSGEGQFPGGTDASGGICVNEQAGSPEQESVCHLVCHPVYPHISAQKTASVPGKML